MKIGPFEAYKKLTELEAKYSEYKAVYDDGVNIPRFEYEDILSELLKERTTLAERVRAFEHALINEPNMPRSKQQMAEDVIDLGHKRLTEIDTTIKELERPIVQPLFEETPIGKLLLKQIEEMRKEMFKEI